MRFEEKFGVKVDIGIPKEEREVLYSQFERWLKGESKAPLAGSFSDAGLLTRYEHFVVGSGTGLPPDPFKPIAAYGKGVSLESVVAERRKRYEPGKTGSHAYWPFIISGFEEITGLEAKKCKVVVLYPEITPDCRVPISKIIGVVDHENTPIDISDTVIAKLQFPAERVTKLEPSGVSVREVFDFVGGYRIELRS